MSRIGTKELYFLDYDLPWGTAPTLLPQELPEISKYRPIRPSLRIVVRITHFSEQWLSHGTKWLRLGLH